MHPIQCRLVTPDDPDEREAYLKKNKLNEFKDKTEKEAEAEKLASDEPLSYELSSDAKMGLEPASSLLNEFENAEDLDSTWHDILGMIKARTGRANQDHTLTTQQQDSSKLPKKQQTPAPEAPHGDAQMAVQSFLSEMRKIRDSPSTSKSQVKSGQTQEPAALRDEL